METLSDIDFYLKFTKPLILTLPEINERILAASWVKKLSREAAGPEKVRLDHLKLLLFVLQRRKLAPPFTEHPNNLASLEEFPENQTLADIARKILVKEGEERREKCIKRQKGEGDYPPYISDFSGDLLEYAAVQTITDFGVHAYYAVSKYPLSSWYRVDKKLFPKAAKNILDLRPPPPSLTLTELTESPPSSPPISERPEPTSEEPPTEAETEAEETPKKPKVSRRSTFGATPPSRPIGKIIPPDEGWEPPTWGSNLLEAKLLDEDMEDIAKQVESVDDFFQAETSQFSPAAASTQIHFPAEVLWSSPPHFGLADESPLEFAEEELPSFDEPVSPALLTTVPSPPHYQAISPPRQPSPPPPPSSKKLVPKPKPTPKVKPTRASLLSQKKKETEKAPPPPAKKGKAVAKKGGKAPPGKKKPTPPPSGGSSTGLLDDDVEEFLDEFNTTLKEMEEEYHRELEHHRKKHPQEEKPPGSASPPQEAKPKRRLSRLAKLTKPKIPKAHGASVDLEKSIHISSEARDILEGIVEGPSTSMGVSGHHDSRLKTPKPRLRHAPKKKEQAEAEEMETQATSEEEIGEDELANLESIHGHRGKDPRLVSAFNEMTHSIHERHKDHEEGDESIVEDEFYKRDLSEATVLQTVQGEDTAVPRSDIVVAPADLEDLEATEGQIEEEEEGECPHARRKRRRKKKRGYRPPPPMRPGLEPLSPLQEQDEDDWIPGPEFFANLHAVYPLKRDEREKPAQFIFPGIEFPEHDDFDVDFPEEFLEVDEFEDDVTLQSRTKQEQDDIKLLYEEHYKSLPAYTGVPVTTPRRSTSPERRAEARGGPIADLIQVAELSPNKDLDRLIKRYRRRPPWLPQSPPPSPSETKPLPTFDEVVAKYPPGHFLPEIESQDIQYEQLKAVPAVGLGGMSPKRKAWVSELEDIHDWLWGAPVQTHPTVFDIPGERIDVEYPPVLGSPVSPYSSPINIKPFKKEIKSKAVPLDPYKSRWEAGISTLVQRHSKPASWADTIQEGEREPPEYFTDYDIELVELLAKRKPSKKRRKMVFPRKTMKELRGSAAPGLETIEELYVSPVKKRPDVFDLPPMDESMFLQSPPRELFPGVPMNREEYEDRMRIMGARPMPERDFSRRSRKLELSAIRSPETVPGTPKTRRPAPSSPGRREGPRRRTLRKKLKKRALDFSREPTSPDEDRIELIDVETEVDDEPDSGPLPHETTHEFAPYSIREAMGMTRERPYYPPIGSPRTPRRLQIEELPDDREVTQQRPPRKGKKKVPPPGLGEITEDKVEERVGDLDYEVRQEVEREMRAREAERRARMSLLDLDVPEGLPPPMALPLKVPGYETPPHLRRKPKTPPKKQPLRIMPRSFRDVLVQEEPPELYQSPPPSPPSPSSFVYRTPSRDLSEISDFEGSPGLLPTSVYETPPQTRRSRDWSEISDFEDSPGLLPASVYETSPQTRRPRDWSEISDFEDSPGLLPTSFYETSPQTRSPVLAKDALFDLMGQTYDEDNILGVQPALGPAPSSGVLLVADASSPRRGAAPPWRGATPPPSPGPLQLIAVDELIKTLAAMPPVEMPVLRLPPPSFDRGLYYGTQIPESMHQRMLEQRLQGQFDAAMAAEARARGPEVVEFEYQETVKEHKAPKDVKPASKVVKALKGKSKLAPPKKPPEKKPEKTARKELIPKGSKASIGRRKIQVSAPELKKSVKKVTSKIDTGRGRKKEEPQPEAPPPPPPQKKGKTPVGLRGRSRVQTTKSDQSVTKSKIDTGRKAKKKPEPKEPEPEPPPPLEFDYDLQALQELALTAVDLFGMNLLDVAAEDMPELVPAGSPERPVDPDWPHQWKPPSKGAARLPALTETEEEHRPQIMGQDMMWHLSPQTRVNLRCPEIKVLPEAFAKDSRFKLEQVHLESPPKVPYYPLLPMARGAEIGIRGLEHETMPEFIDADEALALMDEEEKRLAPVGDLRVDERYDPKTETMTKRISMSGKFPKKEERKKSPSLFTKAGTSRLDMSTTSPFGGARRRLDFAQPPPPRSPERPPLFPPTSPGLANVSVLTVDAEPTTPIRRGRSQRSPRMFSEESPSVLDVVSPVTFLAGANVLEAVSPVSRLDESERLALSQVESPGFEWGGTSPVAGEPSMNYDWLSPRIFDFPGYEE